MRGRRLRSAGLALVLSLGVGVGAALPGVLLVQPAVASPALAATIYPQPGATARPGEPFLLTLTVTNAGTEIAPATQAEIRTVSQSLHTVQEAADWLHGAEVRRDPNLLASIDVGDIPAGESRTVTAPITISEGDVPNGWQVLGLHADILGAEWVTSARTAIVWNDGPMPTPVGFLPITDCP